MRLLLVVAAMFGFVLSSPASAETAMQQVFGCNGKTCDILHNVGGDPELFRSAAKEALRKGIRVRVLGPCASGCLMFASFVRKNTCIGKDAEMIIHRGSEDRVYEPFGKMVSLDSVSGPAIYDNPPPGYRSEQTYFIPNYGKDITEWALNADKLPYPDVAYYVLSRKEALRYWKPCR